MQVQVQVSVCTSTYISFFCKVNRRVRGVPYTRLPKIEYLTYFMGARGLAQMLSIPSFPY